MSKGEKKATKLLSKSKGRGVVAALWTLQGYKLKKQLKQQKKGEKK